MTKFDHKYGWHRDLPDQRDYLFAVPRVESLPENVSLRSKFPSVYNQGELGSCTANSIAGVYQYNEIKEKETSEFRPSRLFVYYNERATVGQQSIDAGSTIKTSVQVVAKQGVVPEKEWPYNVAKFTDKPPANLYTEAVKHEALTYSRVPQTALSLQQTVASGYPVAFGFTVYESFESEKTAETGIVTLPKPSEGVLGGHAVSIVGYSHTKVPGSLYFEVRNSWGADWGDKGYCWFPAAYLTSTDLSSDFWVVEKVS